MTILDDPLCCQHLIGEHIIRKSAASLQIKISATSVMLLLLGTCNISSDHLPKTANNHRPCKLRQVSHLLSPVYTKNQMSMAVKYLCVYAYKVLLNSHGFSAFLAGRLRVNFHVKNSCRGRYVWSFQLVNTDQKYTLPKFLAEKSKHSDRVSKIDPKRVKIASLSIWLLDPITLSLIKIHRFQIFIFGNESKFNREITTNASTFHLTTHHLVPDMVYRVLVLAWNKMGDGVKSSPLVLGQCLMLVRVATDSVNGHCNRWQSSINLLTIFYRSSPLLANSSLVSINITACKLLQDSVVVHLYTLGAIQVLNNPIVWGWGDSVPPISVVQRYTV